MKKICYFILLNFTIIKLSNAQSGNIINPLCIGVVTEIQSKILGETRTLNLYLPDNYNKQKSYPVIYLLDGTINEDFLHIAGLIQFFRMQMKMPDCLLVGIANIDRKRDFTFHTDLKELKEKYPTTGGSMKFIDFIEQELQPFIQTTYHTNNEKYIIGQSLGGLLATEILLKKPYLFSHYLIISPSLWWDNESLLSQAPSLIKNLGKDNIEVFVSVGSEGKIMEGDASKLVKTLRQSGIKNLGIHFLPLPKENHATILHKSIYDIFKILYPYKD